MWDVCVYPGLKHRLFGLQHSSFVVRTVLALNQDHCKQPFGPCVNHKIQFILFRRFYWTKTQRIPPSQRAFGLIPPFTVAVFLAIGFPCSPLSPLLALVPFRYGYWEWTRHIGRTFDLTRGCRIRAFDSRIGYDWWYSCAVSVGPANHRGFDRRRLCCSTWLTPSGLHIHIEVGHLPCLKGTFAYPPWPLPGFHPLVRPANSIDLVCTK